MELDGPTSWDEYQGTLAAWNLGIANKLLLDLFKSKIVTRYVKPAHIPMIVRGYDVVINTAPAKVFCEYPGLHQFPDVRVTIIGKAAVGVAPNQIVYNGTKHDEWYRSSRLFGFASTEFGEQLDIDGTTVRKPPGQTVTVTWVRATTGRAGTVAGRRVCSRTTDTTREWRR